MAPVPIYTIKLMNVQSKSELRPLGVVFGNDRERISLSRRMGDSFMGIFGWSSGIMRKKMNDLMQHAQDDLQQYIYERYPEATAVYDAEFNFHTDDDYMGNTRALQLTITGTAVVEKNKSGGGKTRRNKTSTPKTRRSKRS